MDNSEISIPLVTRCGFKLKLALRGLLAVNRRYVPAEGWGGRRGAAEPGRALTGHGAERGGVSRGKTGGHGHRSADGQDKKH